MLPAMVREMHRWPVDSPHTWPVTQKMFPYHDVPTIADMAKVEYVCGFEQTKGTACLTLTAELWGIYCEYF